MAGPDPAPTAGIFVSYRREDTAWQANWLCDRLAAQFGSDQVFRDLDSIKPGDNFVAAIDRAIESCDVLLALIGPTWSTAEDEEGRRRLDQPEDFVRLEIETALSRDVRVIPILVDNAEMPEADEVPSSLAGLLVRQALELSSKRSKQEVRVLLEALASELDDVQAVREATDADITEIGEPDAGEEPEPPDRTDDAAELEPPQVRAVPPLLPPSEPSSAPRPSEPRPHRPARRVVVLAAVAAALLLGLVVGILALTADSTTDPTDPTDPSDQADQADQADQGDQADQDDRTDQSEQADQDDRTDGSGELASTMAPETEIFRNEFKTSPNGEFRLFMQEDGNVTIHPSSDPSAALWKTGTHVDRGLKLRMQGDGNLVVYSDDDDAVWSSATSVAGSHLELADDGHIRIIRPDGRTEWSTEVTVPDVVGRSRDDAVRLLADAGVLTAIRLVEDGAPDGRVVRTEPDARTRVYRGSTVTVAVVRSPTASTPASTDAPTTTAATTTTGANRTTATTS